jgi:hypothetical protein
LLFVIRDFTGETPFANLKSTLVSDLDRIWDSIKKPSSLQNSKIGDYFDLAFAALPHKRFQPEKFEEEVAKLGLRFREGYKDPKTVGLVDESEQPLLLPAYHRHIPADGFSVYASGIWKQIMSNKDLDVPTQQEALARVRCDELSREFLAIFNEVVAPIEKEQHDAFQAHEPIVIANLGTTVSKARTALLEGFENAASLYHEGIFKQKQAELESIVDKSLKALYEGQLNAAKVKGIKDFEEAVSSSVEAGTKPGAQYDFAAIVESEKKRAVARFEDIAKQSEISGASFNDATIQLQAFKKELDKESKRLRQDQMKMLDDEIEETLDSRLDEAVSLEFNKLGSGRSGSGAPEHGSKPASEEDHWDRVWTLFTDIVSGTEKRFVDRAQSFDASADEVDIGLWRLRRKAWATLKAKINSELHDSNLGQKLRDK